MSRSGSTTGVILLIFAVTCFRVAAAEYPPLDPAHPVIGTLESDPAHIDATNKAGARAVVVGVTWDRFEPREGIFEAGYLDGVAEKIRLFRTGGKLVVLDLGIQYPPEWIFREKSSRFVNQYGHAFVPAAGAGDCGVNLVFSAAMRAKLSAYLQALFAGLGNDFYAVRLGGGRYGELGYPGATFGDDRNCYWGFDAVAQGSSPGLPDGVRPCPVADWKPGTTSSDHAAARSFLEWYMASMENYHDWQIQKVRRYFAGPLLMLYPSTGGLRPGQLEAAIQDDCNGATQPEKTGEVGRGYDTARFIAGITDPGVVVYSTWIDGFPGCNDASADPARWNPAHFLASLAATHQPPLLFGGENTGHPDTPGNMEVTFKRLRDDHLSVMFWAFEPSLFDPSGGKASCENFGAFIERSRR
jgi:hypothetical protein